MSLVTLIKSTDTSLRDAVVQIEEWALPKEAWFTGKVDEAGRSIFSILEPIVVEIKKEVSVIKAEIIKEEPKVNAFVSTIETDVKDAANTVKSDVVELVHDVEVEAKKLAAKAEGIFKANTTGEV